MKKTILIALLTLGFTLTGCSSIRSDGGDGPIGTSVRGQALTWEQPDPFINVKSSPAMVGLACSGGGSRAAYLTAAILREIRRSELGINFPDEFKKSGNLIDQIDFVSAVSGGALSAAYFVTNVESLKSSAESPAWNDYLDKMALNYRQREWTTLGALNPVTWLKTLFTKFNRGNIAREDYDNHLYKNKTLNDLPTRPALYLNAFDVGNRTRFIFSRHFIDTDYYHDPMWRFELHVPHDITSENDLVYSRIDPGSISIADAVYASSAFPFVYPNLALNHFGTKVAFKGQYLFLADDGLTDNSGLVTLLLEMKREFDRSKVTRLVLGIYIDASNASFGSGSIFQMQGIEKEYAWKDTYLGQGRASVDAAIDLHEDTVFKYLESTGVLIDELFVNYESSLLKPIPVQRNTQRASWEEAFASGQLALRPLVIGLRLQDITTVYYGLWSRFKDGESAEKRRLMQLFDAAKIPSGLLPEDPETGAAKTNEELEHRLSKIKTDFLLGDNDRKVLDLAAYILVHGKLESDIRAWNNVASNRVNPQ